MYRYNSKLLPWLVAISLCICFLVVILVWRLESFEDESVRIGQKEELDVAINKTELRIETFINESTLSNIKSRTMQVRDEENDTAFVLEFDNAWPTNTSNANRIGYDEILNFLNSVSETVSALKAENECLKAEIADHKQKIDALRFDDFIRYKSRETKVGKSFWLTTSFSYIIESEDVRIAAISRGGVYGVGLAFTKRDAIMETYYKTQKGLEGSCVWECCAPEDKIITTSYKNLHVRMFAEYTPYNKADLRIQLIQLPL